MGKFLCVVGFILIVFGILTWRDETNTGWCLFLVMAGILLVAIGAYAKFDPVCLNCGELVDTAYCTSCGLSMEQEVTVPTCPGCGASYDTDFCGDCGSKIG